VLLDNNNNKFSNKSQHRANSITINNIFESSNQRDPIGNSDQLEHQYHRGVMHKGHEDQLRFEPEDRTHFVTMSVHRNAILIPIVIQNNQGEVVSTFALIDSGATASFVSTWFVENCGIDLVSRPTEDMTFTMADQSTGTCNQETNAFMTLAGTHHKEFLTLKQIDNCSFPVILGYPWLSRHEPNIHWRKGIIGMTCLFRDCKPCKPSRHTHVSSDSESSSQESSSSGSVTPSITSVYSFEGLGDNSSWQIVSESLPSNQNSPINDRFELIDSPLHPIGNPDSPDYDILSPFWSPGNVIASIIDPFLPPDFQDFNMDFDFSHHPGTPLSMLDEELMEFNNIIDVQNPRNSPLIEPLINPTQVFQNYLNEIINELHNSLQYSFCLALTCTKPVVHLDSTIVSSVPRDYQEYASVFSKAEADRLPPHRIYDHSINLKPETEPPFGPIYNLSKVELETLHDFIKENLAKGFIERSESPAGAPVLFVKKKDNTLRMCVDYRGLNKITVPNRCPLPLISETLDRLHTAKIYTKLDMRGAYNLVRISKGDEWKTAFRTRYGHFQFRVMPFGLCNAPATFQAFVNDTLREYLDKFLVVYLDDILIYSSTPEEHTQHVKLVLEKLQNARLSLKLEKCEFNVQKVEFLGFIITPDGIAMDPSKVEAIKNWPVPKNVHDIQVFTGLTNFYRRFIKDYSKKCVPLTDLLKKDMPFDWTPAADSAFHQLISAIISNPILEHYNPELPCTVECDASDFALGAVCSQPNSDGILRPIAFYSRKLLPAELNYQIYDKELLAIVSAFKHWRHYLEFSITPTIVLTDHKNLEYFTTTRALSRRQVRWSEILADFNFTIQYRPGKSNGAADALSRRDKSSLEGGDLRSTTEMTLLKPEHFANSVQQKPLYFKSNDLVNRIAQLITQDEHFGPIYQSVANQTNPDNDYLISHNILLFKGLICIPDSDELKHGILSECHDQPTAGHFGIAKTHELVTRNYYWPGLRKYVKDYIAGCDICNRSKNSTHMPYGLLQSLPVPTTPWTSISVDFITQLPPSGSFSAICVFVDRFTKMALFIPTVNEIDAEGTADLFINHVFCHYGLPDDIVSDRGATFTSKFMKAILQALKVKQKLSTAFHPQTDGQTERVNSILEQYLRCYVNYQQSDWDKYLPIAQFAYNNSNHSSTKVSPFYALYGFHPRLSVALPRSNRTDTPADTRIQHIKDLHEELKFNIGLAQENHKRFYDKKVQPGPQFKVGDKVWLSTRNIKTQRPTGKLDHKRLGPFQIIEATGTRSFKLALPHTMKIHPVFHMSLLEPYHNDTIPGREPTPSPPVIIEQNEEYEVEQIIDSRIHRNTLQYLVHWKGYTIMDRTWEPKAHLTHCQRLIEQFHKEHPERPAEQSHRARPKRGGIVMNTKRAIAINSIVLNDESKYQIGVINPSALTPYNPPIQIGVTNLCAATPYKSPIQIGVINPSAFYSLQASYSNRSNQSSLESNGLI
jgi:hypothetical protein